MSLSSRASRLGAVAALAAGATLGVLALIDEEEEGDTQTAEVIGSERSPQPTGGDTVARDRPRPEPRGDAGPSPQALDEREVERTVRTYVTALNDREGDRACALFASGALDEVELPREGGGCGQALTASIGYRDPRGFPQWEEASLERFRSTEVRGGEAKVTATIVSEFADRAEPSVEDDVIYLEQSGDRWLIAQPSALLYRAIGAPDLPLDLLEPPS